MCPAREEVESKWSSAGVVAVAVAAAEARVGLEMMGRRRLAGSRRAASRVLAKGEGDHPSALVAMTRGAACCRPRRAESRHTSTSVITSCQRRAQPAARVPAAAHALTTRPRALPLTWARAVETRMKLPVRRSNIWLART